MTNILGNVCWIEILDERLLTRQQAAYYLGVAPKTLAAWARTGRYDLRVVRIGQQLVRYKKSDLDWLIAVHQKHGNKTRA